MADITSPIREPEKVVLVTADGIIKWTSDLVQPSQVQIPLGVRAWEMAPTKETAERMKRAFAEVSVFRTWVTISHEMLIDGQLYYLTATGYPIDDLDGIAACVRVRIHASGHALLTRAELQVLDALGRGETVRQIAERLSRSQNTIDTHAHNIKRKLGLKNMIELVAYAARHA